MNSFPNNKKTISLSLAALGIVYGDIGTSPLYALREALHGLSVNYENVLGILSLIFWSLILIISIKYLVFILRADNEGEGGVLALLALLKDKSKKYYRLFFVIGVLGAGLLLGDGMLTPAISVVSAIEGLKVMSPHLSHYILPLTSLILVILFLFQHKGTDRIGKFFGPILLIWFTTLAILGSIEIIKNPIVIFAINPYYAFEFFIQNGWTAYILLGGIFLVVTGGEALYADLGHFGKTPIRLVWFTIVLPGLLLNYFGQGAYLLQNPDAIINPFYALSPSWFSYPLLILSTAATIIASQAVISATFSLTKQAILLDLYPRLPIIQTSEYEKGQIYVPQVNFILATGTLLLIVTFKNSSALTHAYGIAVNLVMLGVTILVTQVAYFYWRWSLIKVISIFSIFILIELAFLGSNFHKITTGGWVPLLFAAIVAIMMITWKQGVEYLQNIFYHEKQDLKEMINQIDYLKLNYLQNSTSIFISNQYDITGGGFIHYLKLNQIMPEHVLIMSIEIKNFPYISLQEQYQITQLNKNIFKLVLRYGFMDTINIPEALSRANKMKIFPFIIELNQVTYLVEIPSVIATQRYSTLRFFWQEKLFAFLMRNASLDIEFFKLPYDRTIAIGTYCEI